MAEDKVITIRLQEWKTKDMELYRSLERGKKELGISMPGYVKGILRQYVEKGKREATGVDVCMEQIRGIMHEELASQSAELAGAFERIAERLPGGINGAGQSGQPPLSI